MPRCATSEPFFGCDEDTTDHQADTCGQNVGNDDASRERQMCDYRHMGHNGHDVWIYGQTAHVAD